MTVSGALPRRSNRMIARTRRLRLTLVTLRSGRAARSFALLGVTCALMLALSAASASAATLSPTPDPLVGSTFQGGDGNQTAEGSSNLGPNTDWQNVAGSAV